MTYEALRFLSGDQVAFREMPGGELALEENGARWEYVRAYRTHPMTDPARFISLRACAAGTTKEVEVGILRDMADLSGENRRLLEDALARRYLVQTIREIKSIREEFGYLYWEVATDRGDKQLVLPRWAHANVIEMGESGQGRIVVDVWGNRSLIPDLTRLDERSRTQYERFVYW